MNSTLYDEGPSVATDAVREAEELIGKEIDGRYRVDRLLGAGGMGLVYEVTHTRLGKKLAIKVLRERSTGDSNATARFQREAESASAIGNAHIVDVTDFGTLPDGSTYFVMEYLEGVDLISAMRAEGAMPLARACGIGIQLCQALSAAHDAGIVHRDLKPENVFLVEREGNPDFVKVLDFGIAKVAHSVSRLTREVDFLGTPHYMSPEQCEGLDIDHRTDIYALGVLLYEMVAARVPHDADTAMAILHKHVYERPTPIELYVPHVPLKLKRIIARCLEKKPERRYPSMRALQSDLERLQLDEGGESPGVVGRLAGRLARRATASRVSLLVLGAATLALVAVATESAWSSEPSEAAASVAPATLPVRVEPERGVPALLARPVESPPGAIAAVRATKRAKARSSSRGAQRNGRRERVAAPPTARKSASKSVQQEDVLDPWM